MESINITLLVSIKDTDELIQQIKQQLDNTPILPIAANLRRLRTHHTVCS